MEKNKLHIVIYGPHGSGKSFIAFAILTALKALGFEDVTLINDDRGPKLPPIPTSVVERASITITENTTARSPKGAVRI